MKPFSKFKAISGAPVVTREGKKVTQLKEFEVPGPFQVVGLVDGNQGISTWTDDGKYYGDGSQSHMDLFMASAVVEGWAAFGREVAQSKYNVLAFATHVWATEAEAVKSYKIANDDREPKGTVRISWEE